MKKWAVLLVFLAHPAVAQNQFKGGNDIYPLCVSPDTGDKRACLHYILGVSDSFVEIARAADVPGLCYGPHVTAGQIFDIVVKYLREHPKTRDASAASLISLSLMEAFPCPAK